MSVKIIKRIAFVCLLGFTSLTPAWSAERTTYYHLDLLGSPVAATDSTGQEVWREEYKPYGERTLGQDQSMSAPWYTGKVHEEALSLSYFGARWYDPELGRFTGIDPVDVDENNLHTFNRYAYANNNPYRFVDPDGQASREAAFQQLGMPDPSAGMASGARQIGEGAATVGNAIESVATDPVNFVPGGIFAGILKKFGSKLVAKSVSKLSKSQLKAIGTLENQIQKHQQKLDKFKANPTVRPGMENLSKDVIKRQQQRRINHLETEISTFKNNIEKIKNGDS